MNHRRSGFTLAEVVIAASITMVIGLAVAGVSMALGDLHEEAETYYEFLQNARVATSRFQATLRHAHLVTAASPTAMVIWANDDHDPGHINVSELVGVYLDPTIKKLLEHRIVFPPDLSNDMRDSLDERMTLAQASNVDLAENLGKLPQYQQHRMLAGNVTELQCVMDAAPPLTRTVSLRVNVGQGDRTVALYGGAVLRAEKTAYVGTVDGAAVLSIPPEHLPSSTADADANTTGT